jgi:preprotein translocase subunit SecG
MFIAMLILHLLVCLALVAVVLVQSGKGGGLAGGAFGGSAQTVFGGKGATDFITRATMVLGGLFFVTSLSLALLTTSTGRGTRSLIQEEAQRATQQAPTQLPSAGAPAPAPSGGGAPAPAGNTPAPAPAGGGN